MSCRCRHAHGAHEHIVRNAEFRRVDRVHSGISLNGLIDMHKLQFWNVLQQRDEAIRVVDPAEIAKVGSEAAPPIVSDADEEILMLVNFSTFVKLRGICVSGPGDAHGPSVVKLFSNRVQITGFESVNRLTPDEKVDLVQTSSEDEIIFQLNPVKFMNVSNVVLFFDKNFGDLDETMIQRIEFFGEDTGKVVDRPLATNVVYELRGNPADHPMPESEKIKHVLQ